MALDIVAFDFPVAFAAAPRVYAMGFPVVWILCLPLFTLFDYRNRGQPARFRPPSGPEMSCFGGSDGGKATVPGSAYCRDCVPGAPVHGLFLERVEQLVEPSHQILRVQGDAQALLRGFNLD